MTKSTMETIIDRKGKMRFNIYPFKGPYTTHKDVNVKLPHKKGYETISITRQSLYRNQGALSHDKIDQWIQENHYAREKGDDIFVFDCSVDECNGQITYQLTKLRGKRTPKSREIRPIKEK